jgi:hypothetical protein
MQISTTGTLNSPSEYSESFSLLKIIKMFKYELIRVIIFLFLFAASLIYVSSESHEYYKERPISLPK